MPAQNDEISLLIENSRHDQIEKISYLANGINLLTRVVQCVQKKKIQEKSVKSKSYDAILKKVAKIPFIGTKLVFFLNSFPSSLGLILRLDLKDYSRYLLIFIIYTFLTFLGEAAKKVLPLVVGPLRGEEVKGPDRQGKRHFFIKPSKKYIKKTMTTKLEGWRG